MADIISSASVPKPPENENSFTVSAPQLTLPKGGGAIRGIGEKFTANPVTGTGTMSVPLYATPGRSGFGPQLSLSYDSGSGNGPFGLGWRISLPSITRKTEKGLPLYDDAVESDVFILAGSEDLVPEISPLTGQRVSTLRTVAGRDYLIHRYFPRIEGLFAKIERWSNQSDRSDVFWRTISRENVTTWYGRSDKSRIADPKDDTRIYSWLICEIHDDKGNVASYGYKQEDSDLIDASVPHERNRSASERSANRYLKRIRYGNHLPYRPILTEKDPWPSPPSSSQAEADGSNDWFFELVLDYGDHDKNSPLPLQPGHWPPRSDPFSSYRPTFEVRTYRLCQRALMFHHFPDEAGIGADCLVRSTALSYSADATFSLLNAVQQTGFRRAAVGGYVLQSMPPVTFRYSGAVIDQTLHDIDPRALENLPYGLQSGRYQWVDLDGEGASGILSAQAGAWYYKRNLSPISPSTADFAAPVEANFAPTEIVARQPIPVFQASERLRLLDISGDGRLDLVDFEAPTPGFYERTPERSWNPFHSFECLPNLDWNDPNLKFIDLTGDGLADVIVSEDSVFTWYASRARKGFGTAHRVAKGFDEEKSPAVLFSDATQAIFLADMTGDGLTDIVRVKWGEICYWPNMGYAQFGTKVTMTGSLWLDAPDRFDARRVHLADIDGTGAADLLYVDGRGIQVYFNQCGNGWSARQPIDAVTTIDDASSATVVDLLGNGTACLVWSCTLAGDARRVMRYIDLMGGEKPHLLIGVDNNLGATSTIDYAPSTLFYLADRYAGKPWATHLPFVVHCVRRIAVYDKWRNCTFSSLYSYHHGYFDGAEREFRGFGRVEQVDVEDFGAVASMNSNSPYVTKDKHLFQPPVKTITWYHTGVFSDEPRILSRYEAEYFPNSLDASADGQLDPLDGFKEAVLPEPDFGPSDLTADEWREALRACKGMMLRQEVYQLDVAQLAQGKESRVKLLTTAYRNCHVDRLQSRSTNRFSVFLATESEAITFDYDLDLKPAGVKLQPDPRTRHTLNLKVDKFGQVLQSVEIAYPRRLVFQDAALDAATVSLINDVQQEAHLIYRESIFTAPATIGDQDNYRICMPWEVKTFELTGIVARQYLTIADLRRLQLSAEYPPAVPPAQVVAVAQIPYQSLPDGSRQLRLIEDVRSLYYDDRLAAARPPRDLGILGLLFERYRLAFTDDLLASVFNQNQLDPATAKGTAALGKLKDPAVSGYLSGAALLQLFPGLGGEGDYWIRSGTAGFATVDHFHLPQKYTDAFGNSIQLEYTYDLVISSRADPLGNTISVDAFDFRIMAPRRLKDVSANVTEVAFDILGLPTAIALLAKDDGTEGDSMAKIVGAVLDVPLSERQKFFTTAYDSTRAPAWLATATSRYVYWFGETIAIDGTVTWATHPAAACGIAREVHLADVGGKNSALQIGIEYTDGLGAVLVKKSQAEPDPTDAALQPPLRWIASGKTVLNNKGKEVKRYESYYSDREHRFDPDEAALDVGVTAILYYDALSRLIRTDFPDGSFSHTEFTSWLNKSFDGCDTVLESDWYASPARQKYDPQHPLPRNADGTFQATPDQRAAWLTARFTQTPAQTHFDSVGRGVLQIAQNRVLDPAGNLTFDGKQWRDAYYTTFTRMDAEGKPLWVRDANGHLVMQFISPPKDAADAGNLVPAGSVVAYDIAGRELFRHGMDSGDRWILQDAASKPMLSWDRNQRQSDAGIVDEARMFIDDYDALRRPTRQWLLVNDIGAIAIGRMEYQDALPDDLNNLNGQLVRHYDGGGLLETVKRDFKGNVEVVRRSLPADPTLSQIDWSTLSNAGASKLSEEVYTNIALHDALGRSTTSFDWHLGTGARVSIISRKYNARGVPASSTIIVGATKTAAGYDPATGQSRSVIDRIDYDARSSWQLLVLGNGTRTVYSYDQQSFRLTNMRTTRAVPRSDTCSAAFLDPSVIQDLSYTYDPVGNVIEIIDGAQATSYGSNQRIDPIQYIECDALYRLTSATGRESATIAGPPVALGEGVTTANCPAPDPAGMRNYQQRFTYDAVGNIVVMSHVPVSGAGWTRNYAYAFDDGTQPASNRLWQTWTGADRGNATSYRHDAHGNLLNLSNVAPQFQNRWDYRDMIGGIDLGGGGRVFYQYDSTKQRCRKVIQRQIVQADGSKQWQLSEERIYFPGFERYRRYDGSGAVQEEIETHHEFESQRRVFLVDDVIITNRRRADGTAYTLGAICRFQYGNHLRSTCLELDEQAAIISYEEYHPYGTSSYRALQSQSEAARSRYRYSGMERDEETGLSYYGARHYAAWLGRWTACDPATASGASNAYQFVRANPLRFTDPDGRAETDTSDVGPLFPLASNAQLNQLVNARLEAARKEFGIVRGTQPTQAQRKAFVERVSDLGLPRGGGVFSAVKAVSDRDAVPNKTEIERIAAVDFPNQLPGPKYDRAIEQVTRGKFILSLPAFLVGSSAVNPSIVLSTQREVTLNGPIELDLGAIKAARVPVGTDKLGHFFAQGYEEFEISVLDKKGDAAAEKRSFQTELGKYGLGTTGVFSFADLEANKQGREFYKQIFDDPFKVFDIADYVSSNWNEDRNTDIYSKTMERLLVESGQLSADDAALNERRLKGIKGTELQADGWWHQWEEHRTEPTFKLPAGFGN